MSPPEWLQRLYAKFSSTAALDEPALEALRREHRSRCIAFKLLVGANNQALEIMADMEETLREMRPCSLRQVREQCVRLLVCVHRIVAQLQNLSCGKYPDLIESYEAIAQQIKQELPQEDPLSEGGLLRDLRDVGPDVALLAHEMGPKMASLAAAAAAGGVDIPEGFVLTVRACRLFFQQHGLGAFIEKQLQSMGNAGPDKLFTTSSALQQAVLHTPLPAALGVELERAAAAMRERFGPSLRFAVRSSALTEDAPGASFAGQYRSELNVPAEELPQACREVLASLYGVTALSYRLTRGQRDEDAAMCVACMRMVNAEAGGVVYTRNPLGLRNDCLTITVALGLPKAVVDGSGQTDLFLVHRESLEVVRRSVAVKSSRCVCNPQGGVTTEPVEYAEGGRAALDDDEIRELAGACMALEAHFGCEQDVEFAFERGEEGRRRLYILQSRPLQMQSEENHEARATRDAAALLLRGGVTASKGVAAGEIFVLRKDVDVVRCPDGAVAVAEQALPRWAPLLHRIAALVTAQGSMAGHLGTVAREFGVPAIFGLEGCVATLGENELVTVDADECAVYRGRVEVLLEHGRPRPAASRTAVHELLERVLRHVTPLHLLEPEAENFSPQGCSTLHDITRFCHEMSVRLMFEVDADRPGLAGMSRQLFHQVPMQYWIIDLDDGLAEMDAKKRGRFVLLEDIRSLPMLALWRGMTAVPAGPPVELDARGFLSVLMEAAVNPELEAARPGDFAVRNHFMITRRFCCLQARFGFHFCTVEGVIGDTDEENYASFQFKGGAADLERRLLRARLLQELLEEEGFRTELKQDALFARVEGLDRVAMEHKFMVLGYLIIHTRQLDMVMTNREVATARKTSMLREMRSKLAA